MLRNSRIAKWFWRLAVILVAMHLPQRAWSQTKNKNDSREVLSPLTDEERSLNLRNILLNQPDFAADFGLFAAEGFGAHSWSNRLVRKGTRYREESQFWTFVGEVSKSTARLYPQAKVYDDMQLPHDITAERILFNPGALAQDSDASFTALGTLQVDGHNCIKIRVERSAKSQEIYLYLASDLRNLAIAAQVIEPNHSISQNLRNISLDVPDSLVQIPSDYKPIEHDRWIKVETARVMYGDKQSQDFGVFRAPGGELFIWIQDAYYPWEYLVRPQQETVEIAFQGLLVNRSGQYIWQTKETEAFSLQGYRTARGGAGTAKAVVKPNSVTFRSQSYERDHAMIEVSW